ncbi:MAG: N-acetylneuraminate lyase [Hyphomicrobiaceae bacterium]|nr:N-acetylneuraminate lyase [Hyphomicrobiaceae bacterium]
MLTPFDAQGMVDETAIGPMVDLVLGQGIDGLYAGGSTGECVLQSLEQRQVLLRALADYAKGKCTLVAHVGSAATGDAQMLARTAGDAGFDAVAAVPPYYYKFSAGEIADYYAAIADASDLPLIVYHIPVLTGVNMTLAELERLLGDDRVIGIKFTDSDLFKFERLINAAPDKLHYFGSDEMFLGAAAMGAYGGIGSTYNVIGGLIVAIKAAVDAGDLPTARALQTRANEFIAILLKVGVVPGLKHALAQLGAPIGQCLPPFKKPAADALAQLDTWLATQNRHLAD